MADIDPRSINTTYAIENPQPCRVGGITDAYSLGYLLCKGPLEIDTYGRALQRFDDNGVRYMSVRLPAKNDGRPAAFFFSLQDMLGIRPLLAGLQLPDIMEGQIGRLSEFWTMENNIEKNLKFFADITRQLEILAPEIPVRPKMYIPPEWQTGNRTIFSDTELETLNIPRTYKYELKYDL